MAPPLLQVYAWDARITDPDADPTAPILAAFPVSAPALASAPPDDPARAAAVSALGLAGGLVGFGGSLREAARPTWLTVRCARSRWALWSPSPGLWWLLVADEAWAANAPLSDAALQCALRGLAAGVTFAAGGALQALVDGGGASVERARDAIGPPLAALAARLSVRRGPGRSAVTRPLGGGNGPPLAARLPGTGADPGVFGAAAAAGAGLLAEFSGGALAGATVFLAPRPGAGGGDPPLLLWTSEDGPDVGPLSCVAAAVGGAADGGGAPGAPPASARAAALFGTGRRRPATAGTDAAPGPPTCPAFDPAAWRTDGGGLWGVADGGGRSTDLVAALPAAFGADRATRRALVAARAGRVAILLSLPGSTTAPPPALAALPVGLGAAAAGAAAAVAAAVEATTADDGGGHVRGVRYAWADPDACLTRASPAAKAATLTAADRALAAAALAGLGWGGDVGGGGGGDATDAACVVRAADPGRPAWAGAARSGSATLAAVLPRGVGGDGLGGAVRALRAFEGEWFGGGGDFF